MFLSDMCIAIVPPLIQDIALLRYEVMPGTKQRNIKIQKIPTSRTKLWFISLRLLHSTLHWAGNTIACTLDSLINVPGTFVNFWKFFQGLCSYLRRYVYWIWRFLNTKLEFSSKNPLYYNILLILSMGIRLYQGGTFINFEKKSRGYYYSRGYVY